VILIDTSIWIDHINHGDRALGELMEAEEALMHPFVIGEIVLGTLRDRDATLRELGRLPLAYPVDDNEVIEMIVAHGLHGVGIGYVDAHLVASCLVAHDTYLWTRDRRLAAVAGRLGVDAEAV
jgi:predicted nucleic acid-binding protein